MLKKVRFLSAAALLLLAASFCGNSQAARSGEIRATAVFDSASVGISGDLYGQTYTDNQLGVKCIFDENGGGFLLDTTGRRANPKVDPPRMFTFNFSDPLSCPPVPSILDPSGALTALLNVRNIYSMAVGAQRDNVVGEILLPDGRLQFATIYGPDAGYCSTYLHVEHPTASRWEIYSMPNPTQPGSPRSWGDIALRVKNGQGNTLVPTNHYHLPFHLTATLLYP